MSTAAIIMMIIACVTVFGGVIAAVIHIQRNPDDQSGAFGAFGDESSLHSEPEGRLHSEP